MVYAPSENSVLFFFFSTALTLSCNMKTVNCGHLVPSNVFL